LRSLTKNIVKIGKLEGFPDSKRSRQSVQSQGGDKWGGMLLPGPSDQPVEGLGCEEEEEEEEEIY
jgi:hypothetical protein